MEIQQFNMSYFILESFHLLPHLFLWLTIGNHFKINSYVQQKYESQDDIKADQKIFDKENCNYNLAFYIKIVRNQINCI